MSRDAAAHPFDRSGLAALADLGTAPWRAGFAELESAQAAFLARESEFRSPAYPWPRDPLHTWSRCWEYPWVLHHLRAWRSGWPHPRLPRVADLGSGVTFFPFTVAALGCDVRCVDPDPVCGPDLERAAAVVAHAPGSVRFAASDGASVPAADGELDAVFCVSVLEHVRDVTPLIADLARALAPGAPLLLTIDLDLRGDQEIGPVRYALLRDELFARFELAHPETTVHPADLLRSTNGPYPVRTPRGLEFARFAARQWIARPLLGRPPRPLLDFDLAVAGFALRRGEGSA